MEETIRVTESEIDATEDALAQAYVRCDALQRYMEMMLSINGDLSRRIAETASTHQHILELADKVVPPVPPRYAWPKETPYDSPLQVLSLTFSYSLVLFSVIIVPPNRQPPTDSAVSFSHFRTTTHTYIFNVKIMIFFR